jgi:6-phosphogluconolactonase
MLSIVGSYTNPDSNIIDNRISIWKLLNNGDFQYLKSIDKIIINPTWLSISTCKQFLYSVSEVIDYNDTYSGSISSFKIINNTNDDIIDLEYMNTVSSEGGAPCHIHLDINNKYLYSSNYMSGNLNVVSINEDGSLNSSIQVINNNINKDELKAHVHHSITYQTNNPNLKLCYIVDLGMDTIYHYEVNNITGSLTSTTYESKLLFPTNSGPRHIKIHPILPYAFVICELNSSVVILNINKETGQLTHPSSGEIRIISTIRMDDSDVDMAGSEIHVTIDGLFLYVSNRDISKPNLQRNSISGFQIHYNDNKISLRNIQCVDTKGIHPRHFDLIEYNNQDNEGLKCRKIVIANQAR